MQHHCSMPVCIGICAELVLARPRYESCEYIVSISIQEHELVRHYNTPKDVKPQHVPQARDSQSQVDIFMDKMAGARVHEIKEMRWLLMRLPVQAGH